MSRLVRGAVSRKTREACQNRRNGAGRLDLAPASFALTGLLVCPGPLSSSVVHPVIFRLFLSSPACSGLLWFGLVFHPVLCGPLRSLLVLSDPPLVHYYPPGLLQSALVRSGPLQWHLVAESRVDKAAEVFRSASAAAAQDNVQAKPGGD